MPKLLYHSIILHQTLHFQNEFPSRFCVFVKLSVVLGMTPTPLENFEFVGSKCMILWHFPLKVLEFTDIYLQYIKLWRFLVLTKIYVLRTYLFLPLKLWRFPYFLRMVGNTALCDMPSHFPTDWFVTEHRVGGTPTVNLVYMCPGLFLTGVALYPPDTYCGLYKAPSLISSVVNVAYTLCVGSHVRIRQETSFST